MNTSLTIYYNLKTIVAQIFSSLKLKDRDHPKGRKPILTNTEAVTCVVLKQQQNIATKKSLYEIVEAPLQLSQVHRLDRPPRLSQQERQESSDNERFSHLEQDRQGLVLRLETSLN